MLSCWLTSFCKHASGSSLVEELGKAHHSWELLVLKLGTEYLKQISKRNWANRNCTVWLSLFVEFRAVKVLIQGADGAFHSRSKKKSPPKLLNPNWCFEDSPKRYRQRRPRRDDFGFFLTRPRIQHRRLWTLSLPLVSPTGWLCLRLGQGQLARHLDRRRSRTRRLASSMRGRCCRDSHNGVLWGASVWRVLMRVGYGIESWVCVYCQPRCWDLMYIYPYTRTKWDITFMNWRTFVEQEDCWSVVRMRAW